MIRDQAVAVASDALGVDTQTYECRMHVTMRVHCHFQINAVDLEAAQRICEELDASDIPSEYGCGFEFEDGPWEFDDALLYLDPVSQDDVDGGNYAEDIEFDKRFAGEPFSWEAANIVTDMAKLDGEDATTILAKVIGLIERAKRACDTPEKGPTDDTTSSEYSEVAGEAPTGGPGGLSTHHQAAAGGDPALQAHL